MHVVTAPDVRHGNPADGQGLGAKGIGLPMINGMTNAAMEANSTAHGLSGMRALALSMDCTPWPFTHRATARRPQAGTSGCG